MCFSPQRRAIFRHQNFKKWSKHAVFCTFWLPNVLFATAACNCSTSELQKVVQTCGVLYILTSKCAFRHSGVQFFDIWTDKSGPNMRCFVHFDFQMCFSPQRRAIFRHLNRQKCSEPVMFCTFWLSNVLFATAACNFWFLLGAPTSAPAALTGLLFDWPDTRIIEKTQHFATSLTFGADVSSFFWLSRYCIFCRLTWRLYCWAMHLVFNCPYCRKFLFKLRSITYWLIEARLYDTRCYQVRWLNLGFLSEKTWGIVFVDALTTRPRTPTTMVCSSCNFKNIELCIHLSLPIFTVYIDVIYEYRRVVSDVLPTLASLFFLSVLESVLVVRR